MFDKFIKILSSTGLFFYVLGILVFNVNAEPKTFIVDNIGDEDNSQNQINPPCTPGGSPCTLRTAMELANDEPLQPGEKHTILFAEGVFSDSNNVIIVNSFLPAIVKDVVFAPENNNMPLVRIAGPENPPFFRPMITVGDDNIAVNVEMNGLSLERSDGLIQFSSANVQSNLILNEVLIKENRKFVFINTGGRLLIQKSLIQDNAAGGNDTLFSNAGEFRSINSTFTGNRALGIDDPNGTQFSTLFGGGAIFENVTLVNSQTNGFSSAFAGTFERV